VEVQVHKSKNEIPKSNARKALSQRPEERVVQEPKASSEVREVREAGNYE
jgi:hypothetical protein